MITCKDLQITYCPKCKDNISNVCWIEALKNELDGISDIEAKQYFIESSGYSCYDGLRQSYYLIAAAKVYYPRWADMFEKISVLL